jgi:hypothetical protein
MHADALYTLVQELQKNGYFEHKKMSKETRDEFDKVHDHLKDIEKQVAKKISWKTYVAISVGIIGYLTAFMGSMWSEIKNTNDSVKIFNSSMYELKIDSFKLNQRIDGLEKNQTMFKEILKNQKVGFIPFNE